MQRVELTKFDKRIFDEYYCRKKIMRILNAELVNPQAVVDNRQK